MDRAVVLGVGIGGGVFGALGFLAVATIVFKKRRKHKQSMQGNTPTESTLSPSQSAMEYTIELQNTEIPAELNVVRDPVELGSRQVFYNRLRRPAELHGQSVHQVLQEPHQRHTTVV
jgi:hypothetical protein